MTWHPLCDLDALTVGTPRGVRIDRVGICLVRTAEGIFAVHDDPDSTIERHTMEAISLPTLVQEHLTIARTASSGRSAHTVFGGHDHRLRQTLIALAAGQELAEHESPGEATIHVLAGAVQLTTTTDSALLAAGDVAVIPDERHGLQALEDCAVLLTVAQTL